jgi:hypothetical protein
MVRLGKIKCTYENLVGKNRTENHFGNLVVDVDRASNTPSKNRVSNYGMVSLGIRKTHVAKPCRDGPRQNEGIH